MFEKFLQILKIWGLTSFENAEHESKTLFKKIENVKVDNFYYELLNLMKRTVIP